jgi:outer membrane protein OmpA-like peptidoglycan-associated protein
MKTGSDGIFEAEIPPGDYEISIARAGWSAESKNITLQAGKMVDMFVLLRPEEVLIDKESGQIYLHRKIFFELDSAALKVESFKVLENLVVTLTENPAIQQLRVEGHSDTQGSDDYNLELSQRRAQSVMSTLIKAGIARNRLIAQGLGESRPLQSGDSDAVHATNRRVEFHILQMAGGE